MRKKLENRPLEVSPLIFRFYSRARATKINVEFYAELNAYAEYNAELPVKCRVAELPSFSEG